MKYTFKDYRNAGMVLFCLILLAFVAGEIDKSYQNVFGREKVSGLIQDVKRFRNVPGYDPITLDYIVNKLEGAVNSRVITWKRLGTDHAELKSLARQNRVKDLKVTLQRFRSIPGYGQSTSNYIIDGFENAVKSDVTTWKELETSQAELEKLARQNRVKDLKITLGMFRSIPGYDSESIRFVINELRDAVDSNVTTWEELGTDQAELESLAKQNKAKEGEM